MELPFAPLGFKALLEGRDATAAHFEMASKLIKLTNMSHAAPHETSDPEVVIVEFAGTGRGQTTGERYNQGCMSVIRVHEGNVLVYKNYWNSIAVLRALKDEEILKAFAVG